MAKNSIIIGASIAAIAIIAVVFIGISLQKETWVFSPIGEGIVRCESLDCPLIYDDEKCGQGFLLDEHDELVKQSESNRIDDPNVKIDFSLCNGLN